MTLDSMLPAKPGAGVMVELTRVEQAILAEIETLNRLRFSKPKMELTPVFKMPNFPDQSPA